jgi:signal transduction histidine kinase
MIGIGTESTSTLSFGDPVFQRALDCDRPPAGGTQAGWSRLAMAPAAERTIRVLVAEDEPPLRAAVCDLLAGEPGIEIVGAVEDARAAIEGARALRPDIALLDVRMPGGGPAAARGIREQSPDTRVVALSAYDDQATVLEMFRAGAIAYLVKGVAPEEIVEAIRRATRGQASLSAALIRGIAGELVATDEGPLVTTFVRDLTERRTDEKPEPDLAERRLLLGHLVAVEEERARIAANIHDDSIQAITAAGMRLQILRRKLDDPEQLKLVGELQQTIQLSIARLRRLLFELRPPALDRDGLSAAIALYLEQVEQESDTRYRLDDRLRSQPPYETRTILYRIVQEALTNVRKHAHAREATVALNEVDGGYLVRISDDGVGFDVEQGVQATPGHLGLAAMRERSTLVGGWLRIESAPGDGTTIEVWTPWSLGPL